MGLLSALSQGSERPVRRLVGYYVVLFAVVFGLAWLFPIVNTVLGGQGPVGLVETPQLLRDGLSSGPIQALSPDIPPRLELALRTMTILMGTLFLMLPVAWVYMSTKPGKSHDQQVAQTLIFLPLVVAGIILIVQNSLALAFSLAGVVAAVRFRTTLRDSRDVVYVFLAIAVGFAAGVQTLIVAALVSVTFNLVLMLTWRYDFGRTMLAPTPQAQWSAPLESLAGKGKNGTVPDRDLMLALDKKQAVALEKRFERVRKILGPSHKKPRFNGILHISSDRLNEAQRKVEEVLNEFAGRWRLDEAISSDPGKPDELYYLVRTPKRAGPDDLMTALRASAGDLIVAAELERADSRDDNGKK